MNWLDLDGMDLGVVSLVSGGHFFSHLYLLVFPPLFPILRSEFGLSNVELGLVMSAIQVGTFLQVFAGDVVDRVGGKRVFVLGLVVTALGIGLAGFAGSYVLILVFALVSGVGQSTFHPADYALLDAATDEANTGKSFAIHSFAGSLGFAVAPVVVGGIALAVDWQTALLVAGALGLGYALVAHLELDEVYLEGTGDANGGDEVRSLRASLSDPTLLALFVFVFVTVFGLIGIQTFTPVLVVDGFGLSESVGGTALTAYFTLFAFAVLGGGVIADRVSPRVVIASSIVAAVLLTWIVAAQLIPVVGTAVILTFALIGGVSGLFLPARDRLISAASPAGSTGRSFGFVLTGISLAGVVAPAVLGGVIDTTDVWAAFWLIGGVMALGVVVTVLVTGTD